MNIASSEVALAYLNQRLPDQELPEVDQFFQPQQFAKVNLEQRIASALTVLLDLIDQHSDSLQTLDRMSLDHLMTCLDQQLNRHIDDYLHDPEWQALESLWRSVAWLVDKVPTHSNIEIELLDVSQQNLRDNFQSVTDITQSELYRQVYTLEYDTPGGEPFSAMIADYDFQSTDQDMELLSDIASVAALTHCPFIANVDAPFFLKQQLQQVTQIENLQTYMNRAEFIAWNAFRQQEAARYVGLALPNFILRKPHQGISSDHQFCYAEDTSADDASGYLWGRASFAFAATLIGSFQQHGWCVNIRGPESGGKIEQLPIAHYTIGQGLLHKPPVKILLSETNELALASLGFIPLSFYKNCDYACFFSANSCHQPPRYDLPDATANARINARLPYVFLSSRIAHYLKVLQRETIGANKTANELEHELNTWLNTLVTKMNNPSAELSASHPLREGFVEVQALPDNPGYYRVTLQATPHFQVEGMDIRLSLVTRMLGKTIN